MEGMAAWAAAWLGATVSGLAASYIQEKRCGKGWLSGFWIGYLFGPFGLIFVSVRNVRGVGKGTLAAAYREGVAEGDRLP